MKEMNTIPRKSEVRSISLFGLSVVTVIFGDDVDDFYAQQYASNRLQGVDFPEGADAEIEPPYGATGEIFRYVIKSDRPIKELTAIQDWVIERELVSVPGVADVVSFGGKRKSMKSRSILPSWKIMDCRLWKCSKQFQKAISTLGVMLLKEEVKPMWFVG